MSKDPSPSRNVAIKAFTESFRLLKEEGGSMVRKELFDRLKKNILFTEWEKEYDPATERHRWEKIFSFYTIPFVKAGYLIKKKGLWTFTPDGDEALKKGVPQMIDAAVDIYNKWSKENNVESEPVNATAIEQIGEKNLEQSLEEFESTARDGIRKFLKAKNPYEFQDAVAELLSAMGYHISFKAPRGKDGGIDIIAYNDPLGTRPPRIVVQVKHRPENSVSSDEIQKLVGTMRRDSDVGIFVTSGEFSNPAKSEARQSGKHVELIDFNRFIELWIEYYDKMNDEQKGILPLQPIYFLRVGEG
jgi:restriction system protein